MPKTIALYFLKRIHALAFAGSMGQAIRRLCHYMKAERDSITPAKIKTVDLCRETITNWGMADMSPAITEPAPNATRKAGKAQQSKVLKDEKRVSVCVIFENNT